MILLGAKYLNPSYDTDPSPLKNSFNTLGWIPNIPDSEAPTAFSVSFSRLVQPSRVKKVSTTGVTVVQRGFPATRRRSDLTFPQKWGTTRNVGRFYSPHPFNYIEMNLLEVFLLQTFWNTFKTVM